MKKSSLKKRFEKRWSRNPNIKRLRRVSNTPRFGKYYAVFSLAVLTLTAILWATLGAILHAANADQLVNADLLSDSETFRGAEFAGQHSFLFKLPIFYVIKLGGYGNLAYIITSVVIVLLTVGLLVYILRKIDPRPLPFGTICLALASILLLVPTVPYSGALLPVNMAMVTTRNLEYVLYIFSLICFMQATQLRSARFGIGVLILTFLISSDKLFLSQSIGGALLLILVYSLTPRHDVVKKGYNWLLGSIVATIAATILLAGVKASGVTGISSQGAGPYGLVTSFSDFALGIVYGVAGLFTNLGANPAYDAVTIMDVPVRAFEHLSSFAGFGLLINLVLAGLGIYWAGKLVRGTMIKTPRKMIKSDTYVLLSLSLISSTATAFAVFVLSKHYYAVDARYLAIGFFAAAITASTWLARKKKIKNEVFVLTGAFLMIACLLGSGAVVNRYHDDKLGVSVITERDESIAKALASHQVSVLVGDYWRVIPIKHATDNRQKVMPLADCTTPRTILSSKAWQPDLRSTSFAYLLTINGSLTDFPNCSLEEVVGSYGRPNASYLVSGTLSNPDELLLFYDRGKTLPPVGKQDAAAVSVLPTSLSELPNPNCNGPTTMNIVAHQDDDLLFLNPDVIRDIEDSRCVRTVYITAGDAGNDRPYWLEREQGSQAAYSVMLGRDDLWIQRTIAIGPGQFATFSHPRGNPRISLIFMHIADGNLRGEGFQRTNFKSLSKLNSNPESSIQTVDGQSEYTEKSLVAALTALMNHFNPSKIRTQSTITGSQYADHSDHMIAGQLTQKAHAVYESKHYGGEVAIPIIFYRGYSINELPVNVSEADIRKKQAAFLAYARFDGSVCKTEEECSQTETYGSYILRQYTEDR